MRHDEFFSEFDAMFVELAKRARTGRFEPNCDVYVNHDGSVLIVAVEIARRADTDDLRVGVGRAASGSSSSAGGRTAASANSATS